MAVQVNQGEYPMGAYPEFLTKWAEFILRVQVNHGQNPGGYFPEFQEHGPLLRSCSSAAYHEQQ